MKNIKNKSLSLDSYHNKYCSSDLNRDGVKILKNAVTSSDCDYILFINKFEIINPNSNFSLHVEIMNNDLTRIYGNKNEMQKDISKTMYNEVLKYYIKSCFEDMLRKANNYIGPKK